MQYLHFVLIRFLFHSLSNPVTTLSWLQPIPRKLGAKQKHTLDGQPIHKRSAFQESVIKYLIFSLVINSRRACCRAGHVSTTFFLSCLCCGFPPHPLVSSNMLVEQMAMLNLMCVNGLCVHSGIQSGVHFHFIPSVNGCGLHDSNQEKTFTED